MHSAGDQGGRRPYGAHARSRTSRRTETVALRGAVGVLVALTIVLVWYRYFRGSHLRTQVEEAAIAAPFIIGLIAIQAVAIRLSFRRTRPRPRWQYFLFALGYLVVVMVAASIGGEADARRMPVLSSAMLWPVGFAVVGAFAMIGRGAFAGRIRRSFGRIPPPWLDDDGRGTGKS